MIPDSSSCGRQGGLCTWSWTTRPRAWPWVLRCTSAYLGNGPSSGNEFPGGDERACVSGLSGNPVHSGGRAGGGVLAGSGVIVSPGRAGVGAVPAIPAGAIASRQAASSAPVSFDVVLRPSDPSGLRRLAGQGRPPGSAVLPAFPDHAGVHGPVRQSLTAVRGVVAALHDLGLPTGPVSANRLVIPVATTVSRASALLHMAFESYRLPPGPGGLRRYVAPLLPAAVARVTQAVVGLNDLLSPPAAAAQAAPGASQSCPRAGS